ncbi:MAG: thiamine pyrophosphate-binding protein [Deltaproteobacteria bacterium]|nr:thiamine pyrophosphate-binding protein [Deltaproteobacteria bacterium]
MENHTLENHEIAFIIATFLRKRGVNRIFGLCGGHILPIWDYAASLGIQIIDVRDERAAVHMAHAHAELTGTVGVAMVTAGPGMTNAVTGMANAHVSRVPLVVISGVPPRPQLGMGALQDLSQAEIAKPITRYARTVTYATHVLRELDEAFACARGQGNEPGPAFIEFPTDLLREELPPQLVEHERFLERTGFYSNPDPDIIDHAVEALWSSGRTVVISGRGARGAGESLTRLIDALGCIYLDTAESRGLIADDHPANCPAARGLAMTEADLVLTVGRSLDFQLGYGSPAVFQNARFVRIGTCAAELRGNRRGDVEIAGEVSVVLERILALASKRVPSTDHDWVAGIQDYDRPRRKKLSRELSQAGPGADGAMHPYRLLGGLREVLDPGGFGCLGVGVPFGIAAALAHPEKQVVVVTGDGAFGLNAMDLDTAKRHNARVVFVVANNAAWSIERNDQIETYDSRIVGTELPDCDHAALARALGLYAERVEDPADLAGAYQRAFEHAPALVDVVVTRDASSPDALSGLPVIPDLQPLGSWDKAEKERVTGSDS